MSAADLAALDAYLAALGSMQNAAGQAVRAMEQAEAAGLPPLEQVLTGDLIRAADPEEGGERAAEWIARHAHLAGQLAVSAAPHNDAPNRLAQAIANLMGAGLWPWGEQSGEELLEDPEPETGEQGQA